MPIIRISNILCKVGLTKLSSRGPARPSPRRGCANRALDVRAMKPHGGFPKLGVLVGGPFTEDYSILESIFGSPYFGKLPHKL